MFRKDYFRFVLALALIVIGGSVIFGQTAPVSGKVELQKADGTKVPVQGALVEVYRVDIKSTMPSDKTDKKGNFSFAGLQLGATFVLSVSAPGAKPGYVPNVKPGAPNTDKLLVTLQEGDGKRWTEQEIRDALSGASTASGSGQQSTEMTEEQKKAKAEYDKQVAEVTAKNKETENKNAIITAALKDGNDAFNAKNYDLAITKYTEGIAADPNYVGSAPVLLNNKGVALKIRGIDEYNRGIKTTDATEKAALVAKAKQDLLDSQAAFINSWKILKDAPAAEIQNQATVDKGKYDALVGLTEVYRLVAATKAGTPNAAEAKEAFDAYVAVEPDAAKKAKVQITYGDIMREAGDSTAAIEAYKAVLTTTPDNPDALAGLGLSLFNAGVVGNDKAQMQEGLNYMNKFIEVAPETHPLKSSVKDAVDYLKTQEKLAPQKVTTKKKG
ncbi:MAG TPA: tetratricopeptide repeat protein [Pyrinomonadaceae bacterium]|jgi:tetratricopeptide (TPR) repeat protein|nr:tetratricopeptide repeat protein [Pyrinomonadaceae bacterium]